MVSHNDHLKRILVQMTESYRTLEAMQDRPGDLEAIKRETLKIGGLVRVCVSNVDEYRITASGFRGLRSKFRRYLEEYSFEQEIETMAGLYGNDTHRIKNMRLKILEALGDRKMMDEAEEMIREL